MKTKSISMLMAGIVTVSGVAAPTLSMAQSPSISVVSTSREEDKIMLATKIAENLFFIQQQKATVLAAEEHLSRTGDPTSLGTLNKVNLYTAIASAAGTAYMGYRAYKSKDIRTLFWGLGAAVSGAVSISKGIEAYIGNVTDENMKAAQREELNDAIAKSKEVLTKLESENKQRLDAFRRIDSNIDQKIQALLKSENFRIERINSVARDLGEARSNLSSKEVDLGLSGLFAAGSTLSLVKSALSVNKVGGASELSPKAKMTMTAINGAILAGLSYLTYKNFQDRQEIIQKIDVLQENLSTLEREYKQSIINNLSQL
ncbi:hypothetical protein [Bdellovibrio sp.]|uniref:hypothetical protein n=1 Tax=Bdellovibrio sp. TaxID=28201 RepID=UPI0039E41755